MSDSEELLGAISSVRPPRHMKTPSFYTTAICLSFMPTQFCACVLSFTAGTDQTQCDHINYWEGWRIRNPEWSSSNWNCNRWEFFSSGAIIQQKIYFQNPRTQNEDIHTITVCEMHSGLNECICHLISVSCAFPPLSFCQYSPLYLELWVISESLFSFLKVLSITDFFLDPKILGVILCLVVCLFFFFLTHKENKLKERERLEYLLQ